MPKTGQYGDIDLVPAGPRREFTLAIRQLCSIVGRGELGVRQLGELCRLSSSALSALTSGRTVRPTMESVKALYDRAVEEAGRQGVPVPFIWEEVEGLYKRLMVDNRERRLFAALLAAGVPYDSTGRAVLASGRHAGDSLPVARATEDRQADSPIAWQGIADLTLRLNAGEDSDAAGILRFTGLAAAPTETAAAIVSCLREGLHEEGGTIIVYAAQRAHREVMEIAKGLIDGSHAAGAANLLELTLAG